jgi:hypothetical protein
MPRKITLPGTLGQLIGYGNMNSLEYVLKQSDE